MLRWKTKQILLTVLISFFLFVPSVFAGDFFYSVPSGSQFGLDSYGSYVIMNDAFTLEDDSKLWSWDGERVTFYSVRMGNGYASEIGFSISNGNMTVKRIFINNEIEWDATGSGSSTMRVYYVGGVVPYFVSVNGVVQLEGDRWSRGSGFVQVVDTLASISTYVLSFHVLGGSQSSGEVSSEEVVSEAVAVVVGAVKQASFLVTSNWVSVLLLVGLLLGAVVAYTSDSGLWKWFAVGFGVLFVNFIVAFLVVPLGLLPSDLAFVEALAFKPPSLELASFPLQTQFVLQVVVMGFLLFSIMGSVLALVFKESD